MKKVLIITYYWPPAGGIAVQRWLKFVKYLRYYNWEPIVYTVSNGQYVQDTSLLHDVAEDIEVIRRPIVEPYLLHQWFSSNKVKKASVRTNMRADKETRWFEKLSIWVRGNLFIPDARCLWIRPSVRFLIKYLKTTKVDAIISTGPPHSTHLIGMRLKQYSGISWMADFRDPWTSMDYYQDLNLSAWADKRHRFLENKVIKTANKVIVVGNAMKEEFEGKGAKSVVLLPNGFDSEDFDNGYDVIPDHTFSLVHTGSFFSRRNPIALWEALAELQLEDHELIHDLEIKLIGKVDQLVVDSIRHYNLDSYLNLVSNKPFKEIIGDLKSAQILLLPIDNFNGAKWVITGKLFEYLAVKRPILCIGPKDGDAARIIDDTDSGEVFDFTDTKGIRQQLVEWYEQFKSNNLHAHSTQVELYSRKELTKALATELDNLNAL